MRYKFVNPGDKEAELKKFYRLFVLLVVSSIALVMLNCLVVMPLLNSLAEQFVFIVLIPTAVIGAAALWVRSRMEKVGISGSEWIGYCSKQPFSIVVMYGMLILMILKILGLLK
jgi:multidrug efflux pump subunit AcrB